MPTLLQCGNECCIAISIPTNITHHHGCCHFSHFVLHVVKLLPLRSYAISVYFSFMKLPFNEQNIFCLTPINTACKTIRTLNFRTRTNFEHFSETYFKRNYTYKTRVRLKQHCLLCFPLRKPKISFPVI